MQTTLRFSQARANSGHVPGFRDRLTKGAQLGGELLAFASLATALVTSLVGLAVLVGY